MNSKESKFKNIRPPKNNNVITLGGLVFDDPLLKGAGSRLDLRGYKHSQLARDFIVSIKKHTSLGSLSQHGSLNAYYKGIRDFLQYCENKQYQIAMRMKDIDETVLQDYQIHISDSTLNNKSGRRTRRYGDLIRLLKAGKTLGLWDSTIAPPRNFPYIDDSDKTQPYRKTELLDVEAVCRKSINLMFERLGRKNVLLAQGVDPRGNQMRRNEKNGQLVTTTPEERPWNQMPNLIWYVQNVLDGRYMKHDELQQGHSSFKKAISGGYRGKYRMLDVYGHFYPLNHDMAPFLILLEKRLGLNEISLIELKRDCLTKFNRGYILTYVKRRGATAAKRIALTDDGLWSAVFLIKELLRITEPLVRFAANVDQNNLFLCLTVGAHETSPVKVADACYTKYLMNRDKGWAEQQGLRNQQGGALKLHSRSFRNSKITDIYIETGDYTAAMRQGAHVLADTTINHYLSNQRTAPIHDRTTRDGIKTLKAVSNVTILPTNNVFVAAEELAVSPIAAKAILQGKQDVFFAACRDINNRPDGEPNKTCDMPWNCLYCRNAIITVHVLPRLIAFHNFVVNEIDTLSPDEWKEKFGNAIDIIRQNILPRFNKIDIEHAEKLAFDEKFYVPIPLKK